MSAGASIPPEKTPLAANAESVAAWLGKSRLDDVVMEGDLDSHLFGGGDNGGLGGGLIERIHAMIFQRSSEVLIVVPMAGIGPFTVPSPKRW
jgi:hypothetical protein